MKMPLLAGACAAMTIAAAPLLAQAAAFPKSPVVARYVPADTTPISAANRLMARAEQRKYAFDLAGARKDYRAAADLLLAHDFYAGDALVELAHVSYTTGSPERAARVLEEAAAEAARFGDAGSESAALFDAAVLYAQAGQTARATALVSQVKQLRASHHLVSR